MGQAVKWSLKEDKWDVLRMKSTLDQGTVHLAALSPESPPPPTPPRVPCAHAVPRRTWLRGALAAPPPWQQRGLG